MSSNQLTREQLLVVLDKMKENPQWALNILDDVENELMWDDVAALIEFQPKRNGAFWQACWEDQVSQVLDKNFKIMDSKTGSLTEIEKKILDVIAEKDLPQQQQLTATSNQQNYHIDEQEVIREGNNSVGVFMENVIRRIDNSNSVLSSGLKRINNCLEELIEQIEHISQ